MQNCPFFHQKCIYIYQKCRCLRKKTKQFFAALFSTSDNTFLMGFSACFVNLVLISLPAILKNCSDFCKTHVSSLVTVILRVDSKKNRNCLESGNLENIKCLPQNLENLIITQFQALKNGSLSTWKNESATLKVLESLL